MKMSCTIIRSLSLLTLLATTVQAGTITVNISGITPKDGFLRVVLFNNAPGFPSVSSYGIQNSSIAKPDGSETVTFSNVPAGTYAVSVLHDRNGNKKMDSGMFGLPKEAYGVTNNIYPRARAPKFEECTFVIKSDETKTVSVVMKNP